MAQNRIKFQPGMPMPECIAHSGTETQCEAAQGRWSHGFRCPRCGSAAHGVIQDDRAKRFQCKTCSHQTSMTAATLMAATKLPLTTWLLAIYLLSQDKTGVSALALMHQLGLSYPTAWRIHHKLMTAMTVREDRYLLHGSVQIDDAYLGGEPSGGKPGRGSENKVPFVAAVSLKDDARPLRVKLTLVAGFTFQALKARSCLHLVPGCIVASDGLAFFTAATAAGCVHEPTVVADRKPKGLPEFQWINNLLANLKTSLSGTYHAFRFSK